jgi:hypothetical protein
MRGPDAEPFRVGGVGNGLRWTVRLIMVLGLEDLRWGEVVGLQVSDRVSVRGPGLPLGERCCAATAAVLFTSTR